MEAERTVVPDGDSRSARRGPLAVLGRAGATAAEKAPPWSFLVVSASFHYLGPAFAVLLFARVEPVGVAWLRIATAAAIFALWRRPWRSLRGLSARARRLIGWWGVVLAAMNTTFYVAIDRLPLGVVAAVEYLPVIALAAAGCRSVRNVVALVLAVTGVYLLVDVRWAGEPLGLAFTFANAGLFALYVMIGHRVAANGAAAGIDGLAAAMLVAVAVATPIGAWAAAPAFADPLAVAAGVGVGVASSVIPYVTDQLAMSRVSRSSYALFVSLLPATATVVGIVVLAQIPQAIDVAAVALVVGAVAVHSERKAV